MFTRFNGNVVPFADDATSTNRTVFGGVTQSDAIDDNLNADFKKGWEIVGLNDNPTREDFNAMGYTLGALISYLYEMGISEWNTSQNYRVNSRVIGSDGNLYKSLTGTIGSPNVGNNPTTDAVNWVVESVIYSALTAKTTPVDADLIAIADSTSSFSLKKLSWANIKITLKTYFDTLYFTITASQSKLGTDNLFMIQDQKASGTGGGTFTLNVWGKTTKNTVIVNNISGASVSSSVITLPAGTYYVENEEPVVAPNPTTQTTFKSRLRNVSDSTTLISGGSSSEKTNASSNETKSALLKLQGLFTIPENKNVELQIHNTGVVGTSGYAIALGEVEVYGTLKIWKVA